MQTSGEARQMPSAEPAAPQPRRSRSGERGAALVEFALLMPLLMILVFGTIDFGYLINRSTMINNAAREGAREAIFAPDAAGVEARVRAVTADLDQARLTVNVDCRLANGTDCPGVSFDSEWEPGGSVIVEVVYDHAFVSPAPSFIGLGDTHLLSSVVEMRIEG